MLWLNNNQIVSNASGQPIDCPSCPCTTCLCTDVIPLYGADGIYAGIGADLHWTIESEDCPCYNGGGDLPRISTNGWQSENFDFLCGLGFFNVSMGCDTTTGIYYSFGPDINGPQTGPEITGDFICADLDFIQINPLIIMATTIPFPPSSPYCPDGGVFTLTITE